MKHKNISVGYSWLAVPFKALATMLAVSITLFVAPALADDPDGLLILAFGDSLTAGYGVSPGNSFPAQLETALKAKGLTGVDVRNAGVSGDTSAGGRSRLNWNLSALGRTPDLIILELGANDALRGIAPARTRENLRAILETLRERGIPVLLAGMLAPPNLGDEYGNEFNTIFPDLAEQFGAAFYPFFLDGVAANASLNQDDGIHPTKEGIAIITQRIMPYVLKLLPGAEAQAALAQ